MPDLSLSPSLYTQAQLKRVVPQMSYQEGDVGVWQEKLRTVVREAMGTERHAAQAPTGMPEVSVLWERDFEHGRVQKLTFAMEPGADATAFWCVPLEPITTPMPTLICLQGHNSGAHLGIGVEREDNAVLREVHGDRDYGLRCMKEGFAALCYEQRAFGDRREQHMETSRGGCKDAAMHALMLGWSLMAERIWELGKATDWLLARDDIDAERFGLMGESGGGTTSIYAAALDERYRAIVPACAFCSFDGGILSIAHCTEFYFPGLRQQCEMGDILGLVAPRPAIVAAGTPDHFYPPESVESAFAHAERIYEAAGAGDQIHLKWGDQGHRFYADLTWPLLKAHWGLG